jgi:pSer/pThr/pTyr-binding forkhead associated (FHA) protein
MTDGGSRRPALALTDDTGREVLRFEVLVYAGRVAQGVVDGREVKVDLVIPEDKVSRVHARLTPVSRGVTVEDLGSRNGTFVNDQRVENPTPARNGDRIRFDLTEFVLSDERVASTGDGGVHADPQGTVLRVTPAPKSAPTPGQPVVSVPETPPENDDVGKKGGTVLGVVRRNLPKVWWSPGTGTVVMQGPASGLQVERKIDVEQLEREVTEPTLMVFDGDSEAYPYLLKCSGEMNFWNIGKDAQAHDLSIVLEDPSVSGLHAKVVRRGDRWKISDMLSTNHTYVNGEIFANKFLESKDRLRLGKVECVFLLPPAGMRISAGGRAFLARLKDLLLFRWRR